MIHGFALAAALTGAQLKADSLACEATYTTAFDYSIDQAQAIRDGNKAKAVVAGMMASRYHNAYVACSLNIHDELKLWLQQIGLIPPDDAPQEPQPDATPESGQS